VSAYLAEMPRRMLRQWRGFIKRLLTG